MPDGPNPTPDALDAAAENAKNRAAAPAPNPAPKINIPKITTSPRMEAMIDLAKLSKLLDDRDEG